MNRGTLAALVLALPLASTAEAAPATRPASAPSTQPAGRVRSGTLVVASDVAIRINREGPTGQIDPRPFVYTVTADTKVTLADGSAGKPTDLRAGTRVTILSAGEVATAIREEAAAATRPATAPATTASATLTLSQAIALVPTGTLYPGGSKSPGGENAATQKQLADWIDANLVGRRVSVPVQFRHNGEPAGGVIPIAVTRANVVAGGRIYEVVLRPEGAGGLTVPADRAAAVLRLRRPELLWVAGELAALRIVGQEVRVSLANPEVALPTR